jgi:carbonic anhydrase
MKKILLQSAVALLSLVFCAGTVTASVNGPAFTPDEVRDMLRAGNERYASGHATHPNQGPVHRTLAAVAGQRPVATVMACSDSRVPVEILFDQGVGDLFVIRVAGNVADTDEIGSIEYGVEHLGTPLMVVLGHTGCGAVTAVASGAEMHGSIPALVDNIIPAVDKVKKEFPDLAGPELIAKAVKANVRQAMADLLTGSPATAKLVESGSLQVIGAVYDIEHGSVQWIGEHPDQEAILAATGAATPETHAAEEVKEEHGDKAPAAEAAPAMEEAPADHGAAAGHEAAAAEEESGSSLPIILFVIGIFALIAVMDKTVLKE